jgi:hypothetical protein
MSDWIRCTDVLPPHPAEYLVADVTHVRREE